MGKILSKSEGHNENYLAKVIVVTNLMKHPKADKLQVFRVDGKSIITDMSTKEGDIRILFPIESAINLEYLSKNNDFRPYLNLNIDPKYNTATNPETKLGGFFEGKGRVKAIRLRDMPSEGYMVPVKTLSFILNDKEIAEIEASVDEEFDTIKDFLLLKKYEVQKSKQQGLGSENKQGRKARLSKIIPEQFRFHTDTAHAGRNSHRISPKSWITISDKWHGTSAVIAMLLCLKPLNWFEALLLKFKINIVKTFYDLIYSSRRVIKNPDLHPNPIHFYKTDVWGETANKIRHLLNKGESLYGEIVGYTSDGEAIQAMGGKIYDYGCEPGQSEFRIYRITQTNVDGSVMDLSTLQMQERAEAMGLKTVPILYSGYAGDLFPELDLNSHWNENFIEKLKEVYLEKKCEYCKSDVWAEGIVIRIEGYEIQNLKLKSFNFLESETKELDAGNLDMESAESGDLQEAA